MRPWPATGEESLSCPSRRMPPGSAPTVLCSAPEVVFIVTGEEKAVAVERAFGHPPGPETPASLIRSALGRTRVVADAAAAARLTA